MSNTTAPPREPRLVTICFHGGTAKRQTKNDGRLALLSRLISLIEQRWPKLDAIILPGGFLRLPELDGALNYDARRKVLHASGITCLLKGMASAIRSSPGVVIAAGIDGKRSGELDLDQYCVAWNANGVVGLARKIFPVKGEEAVFVTQYARDYGADERIVELASGHRAILCACYDMFGLADFASGAPYRGMAIQNITTEHRRYIRGDKGFQAFRSACLNSWHALLADRACTVGIVAIHGFVGNSTAYWQKHGLAASSAALGRGYVAGAAHFGASLPSHPHTSPLAAQNVPKTYLSKGHRRPHLAWQPADTFTFGPALVRLYLT